MKQEIESWLTSERDYTEGVKLYQKYGKNAKLKIILLTKDNDYTHEKVAYELGKLVDVDIEPVKEAGGEGEIPEEKPQGGVEPVKEAGGEGEKPIIPSAHLKNGDYPAELAAMVLERQHLTNQKGILANSLSTFGEADNAGRKGVMDKIGVIRERINVINEAERHFIKTGKMPEVKDLVAKFDALTSPLPIDKAELMKLKKSLTEMRTKAKNKLKRTGEMSVEGQKLTVKIGKINERYEAVEKLLAGGQ